MIRLMAFILLCIGIQIIWTGWAELNAGAEGARVTVSETQLALRAVGPAFDRN
jgi:ammonia channel protein AmtB